MLFRSQDAAAIDALLLNVSTELEPVIAGLRQIGVGVETSEPTAAPAMLPEELRVTVDKLRTLLENSDAGAGDLLDELLDRSAGTPLAKLLKPVADAVDDYDFDAALERLKKVETT